MKYSQAVDSAERWHQRLSSIQDLSTKAQVTQATVAKLEDDEVLDTLESLRAEFHSASASSHNTFLFVVCAVHGMERARLEAMSKMGHPASLLADPTPTQTTVLRHTNTSDGGRPLTLGERKSLARRADPRTIERALSQPVPDVIRILLRNPKLNEAQVLALCARRPIQPEVLVEVVLAPRWITRERIRYAFAQNPYGRRGVSAAMAYTLPRPLRADILRSSNTIEEVTRICTMLSETRD